MSEPRIGANVAIANACVNSVTSPDAVPNASSATPRGKSIERNEPKETKRIIPAAMIPITSPGLPFGALSWAMASPPNSI